MSEYLANRDGGKTSEHGLVRFVSNLVSGNTIGTAWQVSQRGAGANMSVDVALGTGKIDTGSGYAYEAWSDAAKNVAITTADATNPRRDIIVAYIDKSVVSSASSDNPGALKFIAVAGTPAGSPSDPSGSTIQSAVGAGNPYAKLARVSVAASASSITNGVIADLRTTVSVNANIGGSDGWLALGYAPSTVTALGNRSYSLVFNSTDLTGSVSPGMRIQATRTVTAPTQCTSLNGTTQYYSKTSPAGMTFTNNFVVSAWVKLNSYTAGTITSRYNGTSGWSLGVTSTGQIDLVGFNASGANFSNVDSYQSIPLNKWVHIAAQLDMSTFTATPTTSYVMIDGVDVPALVSRGGTNPTALIQAGNLEIGSRNAGNFFPGKIAQVAIYNAKVTQANIQATISQGLVGTETSLISAYSFNNSINDLNANANNLTANGSAVATSPDTPFTQTMTGITTGTTNFGIVTAISFSSNTTMVVQVAEGGSLPTSGGVSAVAYSTHKTPYGFPVQRGKWWIRVYIPTSISSTPTSNVIYRPANIAITAPVGDGMLGYSLTPRASGTGSVFVNQSLYLSTTTTTETDQRFTTYSGMDAASGSITDATQHNVSDDISLSVATTYNLLHRAQASGSMAGSNGWYGINQSNEAYVFWEPANI